MANFGKVSEWCHLVNTQEMGAFLRELKEGDIIQIFGGSNTYAWAVCTQAGEKPLMVRHFPWELAFSREDCNYKPGSVHEIDLDNVQMQCNYLIRINNARDKVSRPKLAKDIVTYARQAAKSTPDNAQLVFPEYKRRKVDFDFVERARYPQYALDNRLDKDCWSDWYTDEDLESFSWILRTGDIVQFDRKTHSHWALAKESVWGPFVVHCYGSGGANELGGKLKGTIQLSLLKKVINGSLFRINNSCDMRYSYRRRPASDIDSFIRGCEDSAAFGCYNLFSNNCWDFCMQVIYGIKLPKNFFLRTEWCSSGEDIKPLLVVGDIIEYRCRSTGASERHPKFAIYIERTLPRGRFASTFTSNKILEVGYLSQSDQPDGKAVVRVTFLNYFFDNIAKDKDLRIHNQCDCKWKPKSSEDIVNYVNYVKEDETDRYFFIAARNGVLAAKEMRDKEKEWNELLK